MSWKILKYFISRLLPASSSTVASSIRSVLFPHCTPGLNTLKSIKRSYSSFQSFKDRAPSYFRPELYLVQLFTPNSFRFLPTSRLGHDNGKPHGNGISKCLSTILEIFYSFTDQLRKAATGQSGLEKFSIMLSNVSHTIECIAPITSDDDPGPGCLVLPTGLL
ncbi:hypothetical protein TNCV_3944681 [Trichonephila clavipes]|nr:hypothetical protein TNCV_3944681 [Trichonephila clavipes]